MKLGRDMETTQIKGLRLSMVRRCVASNVPIHIEPAAPPNLLPKMRNMGVNRTPLDTVLDRPCPVGGTSHAQPASLWGHKQASFRLEIRLCQLRPMVPEII